MLNLDERHILFEEEYLPIFDVESPNGLRLVVGQHGVLTEEPTGALERDNTRLWSVVSSPGPEGQKIATVSDTTDTMKGMTGEKLSFYLRDFDEIDLLVESYDHLESEALTPDITS